MISTLTTTVEGDCKSKLDKIKNNKIYSTIMEGTEIIQDVNEPSMTELDSQCQYASDRNKCIHPIKNW